MGLYDMARRVNAVRKAYLKKQAGKVLSPVRRIERVFPPKSGRYVAMTFDDGPDALTVEGRDRGLTDIILEELSKYDAHVTFDVIGTTDGNYPDEKGADGTFMWSGNAFDHYPCFGMDKLGGAMNRPELIGRILEAGHEISNHGTTHTLFGKMRAVYGARHHLETLSQVVKELQGLHQYMLQEFGYRMRLGRPAHYIDKIPDGSSAYDAYRVMGYNYMAASFDGAGWQPLPSYSEEVSAMVEPMRKALREDPECLNGRIIFQKDGCNMARRTPIADALPQQLQILAEYGYKVISVSDLLDMSPFEDLSPDAPQMAAIKDLLGREHTVGYKNNTYAPDRPITTDEIYIMLAKPEVLRAERPMGPRELCAAAMKNVGLDITGTSGNELLAVLDRAGAGTDALRLSLRDKRAVTRLEAAPFIASLSRALES